ncbi:hypothetical protein CAEBREN_30152 [Caenorhabditis brenneri]|uniref:Uncharacterized protein n=1 Tax=Caenorhabditis brenneri TaxID=135651 RepID=G0MKN1_CAEBE|nr:hypothetical protein CAEBREN_30152 [Caenorhabditis brenneri]
MNQKSKMLIITMYNCLTDRLCPGGNEFEAFTSKIQLHFYYWEVVLVGVHSLAFGQKHQVMNGSNETPNREQYFYGCKSCLTTSDGSSYN